MKKDEDRPADGRPPSLPDQVKSLSPLYFAMVMATGILAVACHLQGFRSLSISLFWIGAAGFAILFLTFLLRLAIFFPFVRADLASHNKAPGFLTLVAASGVLGVGFLQIQGIPDLGFALWAFGALAWLLLVYSIFTALIIKARKPSQEKGLNGGILLFTVSTQSLSILAAMLSAKFPETSEWWLFAGLSLFMLGMLFYVILVTLLIYRFLFAPVTPAEFTPPYWVLMGGAAISSLAASVLIPQVSVEALFEGFLPWLRSCSLLFWFAASWWIPLLIILEVWRHLVNKVPLKYQAAYWDTVFTLGMYTVASYRMVSALHFDFLRALPSWTICVAGLTWLVTFAGMVIKKLKMIFR